MSSQLFPSGIGALLEVYEAVRADDNQINWLSVTYEDKALGQPQTGDNYDDLLSTLTDDSRNYCYARFKIDEIDGVERAKFAFITWIGPSVSPLKKAKVSTDKAFVKQVMTQFAKEILADEKQEVQYNRILPILQAASGAAYGTGK